MYMNNRLSVYPLKEKNEYFEVRILKTSKGTLSGYFNDFEKLDKAVSKYNGRYNIFFSLNQINPEIVARSENRLSNWAKETTSDKEIIRRKWILVDLDPIRPPGVSSSQAELEMSEAMALRIQEYLGEKGFSEPIVALSGNGYHLLYPVDLDNTKEITEVIRKFLQALNKKFSDEHVKVDTSTYNAARITKLYGTIACKGENTIDRPHRCSQIVSVPKTTKTVEMSLLQKVISENIPAKEVAKETAKKTTTFPKIQRRAWVGDVKKWLEDNGIEIDHCKSIEDGTCYVLKKCPWNEEHTDRAAYVIQFSNGNVVARCHHDSCAEHDWNSLVKRFGGKNMVDNDKKSPVEILMEIVQEQKHFLFHDSNDDAFVTVSNAENVQTYSVKSKEYQRLLTALYFQKTGRAVHKDAISCVVGSLEAQAVYMGEEKEVAKRCKLYNGSIYYHLGDKKGTVIVVDEKGYSYCQESPVPFLKSNGLGEQVLPQHSKTNFRNLTKKHWKFVTTEDKMMHDILLITRFVTDCPAPIGIYLGERGSSKTTSMKMDKLLVDPAAVLVKALPHGTRDMVATIKNQYMLCYDNIDEISNDQSNLFCIASTGGDYVGREMYTNDEEHRVKLYTRLNFTSINLPTDKADFYDRCVCLTLKRIEPIERKTEESVMNAFKEDIPFLLDRIFRILSKAMQLLPEVEISEFPRMADFAKWGYVIAEVLGYGGEVFLKAYEDNQRELIAKMLEEDSLATALISYIEKKKSFSGTATELLSELTFFADNNDIDTRWGWVKTVKSLGRRLENLQSPLRDYDIFVEKAKVNGKRLIYISKKPQTPKNQ